MVNPQKAIGPLFACIGTGLLLGSIAMVLWTMDFRAKAMTADGVVVDMIEGRGSDGGAMYRPVYEYQDQHGHTHRYTPGSSSNPPAHRLGETTQMYFDPEHPEQAEASGFMAAWFLPSILGILGTIFAAVGYGFVLVGLRARRTKARLARIGRRIQARFTGTVQSTQIRVNGRSPWRLTAQWRDPSSRKVHVFESDSIWYDPSEYVGGEMLDVLINPRDPTEYYVEIDFLPKQA